MQFPDSVGEFLGRENGDAKRLPPISLAVAHGISRRPCCYYRSSSRFCCSCAVGFGLWRGVEIDGMALAAWAAWWFYVGVYIGILIPSGMVIVVGIFDSGS